MYICVYIYIYNMAAGTSAAHILLKNATFSPVLLQKWLKQICPYMDNFFAFFGSSVSVLSINFWRTLECEPKKTSFGGNVKCLLGKICFWLGKC